MSKSRIPKYVVLEKKRGETPLETINTWKSLHVEFLNAPASYAGRLDPMAEGKLLVLLGDECKKQSAYTKLDKEYEVEVLLDSKTDTGDLLGMPVAQSERSYAAEAGAQFKRPERHNFSRSATSKYSLQEISRVLKKEIGKHSRKYPVFSSKTVNGKPLFLYALEGALDTITIPEHIETFYKIKRLNVEEISTQELQKRIENLLMQVPRSDEPSKLLGADFRQDAIREAWLEFFSKLPEQKFTILRLRIICGSGAYMRTFSERIGGELGTTGLALSIRRTKIGTYVPLGLFSFWSKQY